MGTRHDDKTDDPPADCATMRELISAAADDALDRSDAPRLERHLNDCADCMSYQASVTALARATRLRPAAADPAFVDAVLARSRPVRFGRGAWLRPSLAWCGLLLAWQGIPALVLGELDDAPTHIARHIGASTLALAIGLLYVAWRPHRAVGLLPFAAALFGAMLTGAMFDMIGGDRPITSELVHLVEFVGMTLLWMIAGSPGWDRIERAVRPRRRGVATTTS